MLAVSLVVVAFASCAQQACALGCARRSGAVAGDALAVMSCVVLRALAHVREPREARRARFCSRALGDAQLEVAAARSAGDAATRRT